MNGAANQKENGRSWYINIDRTTVSARLEEYGLKIEFFSIILSFPKTTSPTCLFELFVIDCTVRFKLNTIQVENEADFHRSKSE